MQQLRSKHHRGITLGYFFKTIGTSFDKNCFVTDTKQQYCSDGHKDEVIGAQIASITDMTCMYSEKCSEKGTSPTENCVGGLGTDC